eukprot:scaffold94093_cov60-Phaeocystis_antarctica.AAC.3
MWLGAPSALRAASARACPRLARGGKTNTLTPSTCSPLPPYSLFFNLETSLNLSHFPMNQKPATPVCTHNVSTHDDPAMPARSASHLQLQPQLPARPFRVGLCQLRKRGHVRRREARVATQPQLVKRAAVLRRRLSQGAAAAGPEAVAGGGGGEGGGDDLGRGIIELVAAEPHLLQHTAGREQRSSQLGRSRGVSTHLVEPQLLERRVGNARRKHARRPRAAQRVAAQRELRQRSSRASALAHGGGKRVCKGPSRLRPEPAIVQLQPPQRRAAATHERRSEGRPTLVAQRRVPELQRSERGERDGGGGGEAAADATTDGVGDGVGPAWSDRVAAELQRLQLREALAAQQPLDRSVAQPVEA